jgi:hypothetical protein
MSDPTNTMPQPISIPNVVIGLPVQAMFLGANARKFNDQTIQAALIVGGPFPNGTVNLRVLTDGEPGKDPDMPLFRTVPHISRATEADEIAWRALGDAQAE